VTNRNPDVHCYYCRRYMYSEWAAEVWLFKPELKPHCADVPWCGQCKRATPPDAAATPHGTTEG
jgi:hypothetical protein